MAVTVGMIECGTFYRQRGLSAEEQEERCRALNGGTGEIARWKIRAEEIRNVFIQLLGML